MDLDIAWVNNMDEKDKGLTIFLKEIMQEFAKEELRAFKTWKNFHFVYSERSIMSSLVPVLHSLTDGIWLEDPFSKVDINAKNCKRRIDVVTSRNKRMFFIEVKHFFDRLDKNYLYRYAQKRFNKTVEQISDITLNSIGDNYLDLDNNDYKIALMVVTTFLRKRGGSYNMDALSPTSQEYANMLNNACCDENCKISTKPSYVITWKLDKPEKYEINYKNGSEIYPFVSFIVKAERLS
jgi:hypothetical protein